MLQGQTHTTKQVAFVGQLRLRLRLGEQFIKFRSSSDVVISKLARNAKPNPVSFRPEYVWF